jgi:nitrogen-specific signal transduction histidine kinase
VAQSPDNLLDLLPHAVFIVRDLTFEWANRFGASLLHTTSEALAGASVAPFLADGEIQRLESQMRLIRSGIALPDPDRVRILEPGSRRELAVDLHVVRLDPDGSRVLLVGGLPAPPTHAEAVYAKLAKLAPVSDSLVSLEALFARVDSVFAELGWRGFLIEPYGDALRSRYVINIAGDDPFAVFTQGLRGAVLQPSQMTVTMEVLRSGEPVYVDDFVGRLSSAPGMAGESARHFAGRPGIMRGAWVPVPGPTGPASVLLVIGATISPDDSIALRLFTGQIAATQRIEAMQAELVQRERLAAVGEMSAVLAHEVRNPLAIVANAGATLRRILGGDATDDARQLLDILDEETERLNRLVRDLLAFARPSDPQLSVVPLRSLIERAVRAVAQDPTGDPQLVETAVVNLADDATSVRADPELLHRALVNVLLNATQHRAPRGQVRIDVTRSAPSEICVRIFNDGAHLPAEVRDRVFDPFFTTRPHGTGLGLAVVRRTLEDLGGRVEVTTEPDGVAVSMFLPAADASPGLPAAEGTPALPAP